jgi:glycosyltransferase involved in cell wall biosynthesis
VIIPVLNEADQIEECLRHVCWVEEVIMAGGASTDATGAIARAAAATVLENTGPTIADQRNVAIARARNEWVFALDADERVNARAPAGVAATVRTSSHEVYLVRRQNFYLGRELTHGHLGRDWVTRLSRQIGNSSNIASTSGCSRPPMRDA